MYKKELLSGEHPFTGQHFFIHVNYSAKSFRLSSRDF